MSHSYWCLQTWTNNDIISWAVDVPQKASTFLKHSCQKKLQIIRLFYWFLLHKVKSQLFSNYLLTDRKRSTCVLCFTTVTFSSHLYDLLSLINYFYCKFRKNNIWDSINQCQRNPERFIFLLHFKHIKCRSMKKLIMRLLLS